MTDDKKLILLSSFMYPMSVWIQTMGRNIFFEITWILMVTLRFFVLEDPSIDTKIFEILMFVLRHFNFAF